MPILVGDQIEVVDEGSPFYHRLGLIVAFTRSGRPVVQFSRKRWTWRRPWGSFQHTFDPDQVGLV